MSAKISKFNKRCCLFQTNRFLTNLIAHSSSSAFSISIGGKKTKKRPFDGGSNPFPLPLNYNTLLLCTCLLIQFVSLHSVSFLEMHSHESLSRLLSLSAYTQAIGSFIWLQAKTLSINFTEKYSMIRMQCSIEHYSKWLKLKFRGANIGMVSIKLRNLCFCSAECTQDYKKKE